ncbi:MFS transporter [Listeria monocytogenes]|uniref:MFS transporter n=1 Tax=Listeria seeligeri TaxID=1640 RepID=UPI000F2D0E67|nr:MFS transporter [Listeria seeligeri]EAC8103217.1 MFS transporter [Listeria monocytogenes]EAC8225611.1 MFS transporter [Listeria monocytogenes]EAD0080795.1 MFS transporter [Listeria monocytogenes]EAD2540963.1 MFS transporter [Listeria monocytogenes]EAE0846719.1 MFS transporter [Listeria monocytogenes]
MKKVEKQNSLLLVSSSSISRIGNILFDYANNAFLAGLNLNSLTLVGIYQATENITGVIFNLFGGVIADRFRRKRIIILTDFFSGFVCILLSFISTESWLIYAIIVINIFLALLSSFSGPAYKAFTKEVVEKDTITKVNSYLQTTSMIIKISVPISAIGIYYWIGIQGALLVDGISFIISSLIIFFISPIIEEVKRTEKFSFRVISDDLFNGFKYVFHQRSIFILIVLSSFVNFFLAAYNLLLPYGNQMFPKVTGGVYGAFLAAEAVGGLIGAFLSGRVNKKLSINQLMIFLGISGIILSTTPFLYNIFPNLVFLSIAPAFFNLFLTIFNIQFFSFIQKDVSNEYLGRVFGIIFTVAILFMPLGTIVFTMILHPNFKYNFFFIGMGMIMISIIFKFLFYKKG